MTATLTAPRLLAGPPPGAGPERLSDHLARLGPLPRDVAPEDIADGIEASGLLGRGGAGFPVGRKWRAMANRRHGRAVLLANGAEGEPASIKDRVLMATRPHLVIDGAILAAGAVGADEVVFYIGEEHEAAVAAMRGAVDQRREEIRVPARVVTAPIGYVAGEATAAVHYVNTGDARPVTTPPRVSERGVGGRPTLVQNVESLAYTALVAKFGDGWYRAAGRGPTRGTALVTVSGAAATPGVREIEIGTTIGEVAGRPSPATGTRGVLVGGYFGTWARADEAWSMPLDPVVMTSVGLTFGCGILAVLPADACGVTVTAGIIGFLADESAGQCGPCVHGLRAIGDASARIAIGRAYDDDLARIGQLASEVRGRGACHHPDGAAQLMTSALNVFGDEFRAHARTGRCSVTGSRIEAA